MKKFYNNIELDKIANSVVKLMPSLQQFYESKENLTQYSKRINLYSAPEKYLERQKAFKTILRDKVKLIFNKDELKNIDLRIEDSQGMVGGSMDHHGNRR